MNVNDAPDVNMDRLLTDWLDADAAPRAPESLETAFVEAVASTRQRPAWATTERWISMDTRAQFGVMPRALIALLTISLLAIGAVGGFLVAGNLVQADEGGPLAGLTYASPPGIVYRHPTDGTGDPVALTPDDEFVASFAWSPDGTRFAYESWADSNDGPATIVVRDADGSNPVAVSEPFEASTGNIARPYLAWSPDGTRVLFWAPGIDVVDDGQGCRNQGTFCGQRIWVAQIDGSEPARVIGDPVLDARSPVWTPDGESIIFAGSAGNGGLYGIYRMDADGANVERVGDIGGSAYAFDLSAMSPDGTMVAVVSGNGLYDLYLVDLATGEKTLMAGEDEDEMEPYWSPDGSRIAFVRFGRDFNDLPEAMLYDVASGETFSLGTSLWVSGWSPDGTSIISGEDGIVSLVDVTDPTAPVSTQVQGLTEAFMPSLQPRP